MTKQRIVIVGNGIAANSAAAGVRSTGSDAMVTMISAESFPLYSPCAFYKYLAGDLPREKLFLKPLVSFGRDGTELLLGTRVVNVNLHDRTVILEDERLPFDRNSAGRNERFAGSLDATQLRLFDSYAVAIGKGTDALGDRSGLEVMEERSGAGYARLVAADGRLVGAQLINRTQHAGRLLSLMCRRDDLWDLRAISAREHSSGLKPWRHWVREYIA